MNYCVAYQPEQGMSSIYSYRFGHRRRRILTGDDGLFLQHRRNSEAHYHAFSLLIVSMLSSGCLLLPWLVVVRLHQKRSIASIQRDFFGHHVGSHEDLEPKGDSYILYI